MSIQHNDIVKYSWHSWSWRDDSLKALNLVSTDDAIKLSTLFTPVLWDRLKRVKEANIMPMTWKWKQQWRSGPKNSQQNFTIPRYILSFRVGTLILRGAVNLLKSRDVIERGEGSFWCMKHVPVSVIIPVQKKKNLFTHPRIYMYIYIYIYIYIYTCLDG